MRISDWSSDVCSSDLPSLALLLKSSFALTPGFEGPSQPTGLIPEYDGATGTWTAPFVMAPINTKNVHRTNFLLGHTWGEDLVYDEMVMTTIGDAGRSEERRVGEEGGSTGRSRWVP